MMLLYTCFYGDAIVHGTCIYGVVLLSAAVTATHQFWAAR